MLGLQFVSLDDDMKALVRNIQDRRRRGYVLHEDSAAQIPYEAFDEELAGTIEQAIRNRTGRERATGLRSRRPQGGVPAACA